MIAEAQTISQELVQEQLERLRSSPLFSHSRRYPSFLDYVVRKTLEGHQDELKERTVGVEVFGRPLSYDLNADPVVRVTAGEVRKRLAQYYYEPGHQAELRIELRPGSYVPEFRYDAQPAPTSALAPATQQTEPLAGPEIQPLPPIAIAPPAQYGYSAKHIVIWVASVLLLVAAVGCGAWWRATRPSVLDRFWAPITANSGSVFISVGSINAMIQPDVDPADAGSVGGHPRSSDPIALSDAVAISNVQQVLSAHGRLATIQSSSDTTFSDLQKGPVILISGFDNQWTMRLTEQLRFHLIRLSADDFAIEDRDGPAHTRWVINTSTPLNKIDHDYGLLARYLDPTTEQLVVVAAGIGENGTIAASQLLSNEKYMEELKRNKQMPAAGQNFEAVVETQLIDGNPGPPRVLAVHTW